MQSKVEMSRVTLKCYGEQFTRNCGLTGKIYLQYKYIIKRMNELTVVIFPTSTRDSLSRIEKIKSWFYLPLYNVTVADTNNDSNQQILDVLYSQASNQPQTSILLIKDTSMSTYTPLELHELLQEVLTRTRDFDAFYLCKWLDACQKHQTYEKHIKSRATVNYTHGPRGLQCVLLTPKGRDTLLSYYPQGGKSNTKSIDDELHDLIFNGYITALCTVPNIVEFDINAATKSSDYAKMNQCAINNTSATYGRSYKSVKRYWWLILVIILIFLIALAIVRLK